MDLIGAWGKFRIMSIGFGLACFCSILAVVGMGEFGKSGKDKDGKPMKKDPMMGLFLTICGICCCVLISFLTMSAANSDSTARLVGIGNIGSRILSLGRD